MHLQLKSQILFNDFVFHRKKSFFFQNMSVELQLENHGEFSHDHFKMQVDKASGARYGTGVRDL